MLVRLHWPTQGWRRSQVAVFISPPTFTAEDVLKVTNERKAELSGDIYVGTPGQVNRVKKARTPEEIFQPEANSQGIQTYIVQLGVEPLATYEGDIPGFAATKAPVNRSVIAKGRVSVNTATAQPTRVTCCALKNAKFVSHVRQAGVNLKINKQFNIASNALVVEMTQEDAIRMSHQSGVKRISPNRIF